MPPLSSLTWDGASDSVFKVDSPIPPSQVSEDVVVESLDLSSVEEQGFEMKPSDNRRKRRHDMLIAKKRVRQEEDSMLSSVGEKVTSLHDVLMK